MAGTEWAVTDYWGCSVLARAIDDGTVELRLPTMYMNRKEWREFKSQVEELLAIAENTAKANKPKGK